MITKNNVYFFIQILLCIILITLYSLIIFQGYDFLNGYLYLTFLVFSFICLLITGIFNYQGNNIRNLIFFPLVFLLMILVFENILFSIEPIFSKKRFIIYIFYFIYLLIIILNHFKILSNQKAFLTIFINGILIGVFLLVFPGYFFPQYIIIVIFIGIFNAIFKLICYILLVRQKAPIKLFSLYYLFDWTLLIFLVYIAHFLTVVYYFL